MFDEFELSIGPFPDEPMTLTFPTVQTYNDGEVVRWNQPTPPSSAEPEHPAPALELTADGTSSGRDSAEEAEPAITAQESSRDPSPESSDSDDSDTVARTLGALGLVAGIAALAVALVRRRREAGR